LNCLPFKINLFSNKVDDCNADSGIEHSNVAELSRLRVYS